MGMNAARTPKIDTFNTADNALATARAAYTAAMIKCFCATPHTDEHIAARATLDAAKAAYRVALDAHHAAFIAAH